MHDIADQIYFVNKPSGISTHSVDGIREGLCEYLQRKLSERLFVCHRLDKGTSGALLFSRSKGGARDIGGLFESGQVRKTYLLVTDRTTSEDAFTISTNISKEKGCFVSSNPCHQGNSKTDFMKLYDSGCYVLWQARPFTGKPHQIRLHAEQLGIAILGDNEHSGSAFPRLMLHASEIELHCGDAGVRRYVSRAPLYFSDLNLLDDTTRLTMLLAAERRFYLFGKEAKTAYRIFHGNEVPSVNCDRYGELCWFHWYQNGEPSPADRATFEWISKEAGCESWCLQFMQDRGRDPTKKRMIKNVKRGEWQVEEHNLKYILKLEQGLSAGMFLDQRQNRLWVKQNSFGKEVLNLFCYTAGFSLCAAAGGARKIDSVDTSRACLDWARENFALNGLENDRFRLFQFDAREFLKKAARQQKKYDLIICDPPSFARSKAGTFSIKKELANLVKLLLPVLGSSGTILISSNFNGFSQKSFEEIIKRALPNDLYCIKATPPLDWDYELPGEESLLKSLLICSQQ